MTKIASESKADILPLVYRLDTCTELNNLHDRDVVMLMGQTFDHGQPLDLLSYVLVMAQLQDDLTQRGNQVRLNLVLADHFLTAINNDVDASVAANQCTARETYLRNLLRVYGGDANFVRSSQLSQLDSYKTALFTLNEKFLRDKQFAARMDECVPVDRRRVGASRYALEELATIFSLGTNIKIGPPYERHYDEPAREIAQSFGFEKYVSVCLRPAQLFGNPHLDSQMAAWLSQEGITPYKIGSKGMDRFRIDPMQDSLVDAQHKICSTSAGSTLVQLYRTFELAAARIGFDEISRASDAQLLSQPRAQLAQQLATLYEPLVYRQLRGQ